MKIVFAASEIVPFAKTGGLADVAGALPLALEDEGHQVVLVMPRYKCISDSRFKIKKVSRNFSSALIGKNIAVYFVENQAYFNREALYTDKNGDYPDNLDRFSYFCRSSLELLKEIKFKPDIIHVHDWQASLIPVYLKSLYSKDPFFQSTSTLLTVHNIGYQGLFAQSEFPKLGLDWEFFGVEGLEFYGRVNILKGGLVFSDRINTVSPTYSMEIQTKEFGFGLDGILRKRSNVLSGILNGIDYSIWNPQTDRFITQNYSADNFQDKQFCKAELQKAVGLPRKDNVPVVGVVSRLAEQKGMDILSEVIDDVCRMGLQLVILGSGDLRYQKILEQACRRNPKVMSLNIRFDDPLAHKIYAGSDIFLMPSKYEPCGLGQLIAFRYGTIPLVFKTGGLADTVNRKNGFVFEEYRQSALLKTLQKASKVWRDKEKWASLVRLAMSYNFSWKESAKKYIQLYAKANSG